MQRFSYEAIDSQGRKIVNTVDAWDRESLLINLQSRGMVLVRWLDDAPSGRRFFERSSRTIPAGDLLQMTKDLAHLLKSGVPMDKALTIIADSAKQSSIRSTAVSLKESIQGGSTLSEAMAARPRDFSDLYVNMIRVGETGGVLPQVMEKLSRFLERFQEIKKFVLSSSIYPAILLSVGMLSVLVIMGFVVPRFESIFSDLGQEIPFSTRMLINASHFLRTWGWMFFVIGAIGFVVIWRNMRTPQGKEYLDNLILRLPLFGELMTDIQTSRFSRTLGTLVTSGVPLLKALSIVTNVVENNIIRRAVDRIYHQVKEGRRISQVMKEASLFPSIIVQMVSLGEETGKLGEMLLLTAEEMDRKTEDRIKTYLSFLEPITILLMGVIIGGIVVSMFSAIFGINEIQF